MDQLHLLADELREVFSDRGHSIEQALSADSAFRRSRRPQSALARDLVLDGIEAASSPLGLWLIKVAGGSLDIQADIEGVDCRFRVRKATIDPDTDEVTIVVNSDSILTITSAEPESLYPTERWVFAYTVDDAGMLDRLLAARVVGISDGQVPHLILTGVTELGTDSGSGPPGSTGFQPADEPDLDGMEGDQVAGSASL